MHARPEVAPLAAGNTGVTDRKSEVGKGRPPVPTRFKPGQSGNPKGRPRGRRRELPYEAVLGQTVTIREDGVERRLSADAAFLLHLANKGLAGDGTASRAALAAIEEARNRRGESAPDVIRIIYSTGVAVGCVAPALGPLRMATLLDRFRPSARWQLEPWLVQAALDRLGSRRLTVEEQRTVYAATRTPHRVTWPEWWDVIDKQ